MPLILTPIDTTPPGQPPAGGGDVIYPDTPIHNGCPNLTQTPSVTLPGGSDLDIEWVIRDSEGNPIDISGWIEDDGNGNTGEVTVRFKEALNPCAITYETVATVVDADSGVIHIEVPDEVRNKPCIYVMEIGIEDQNGKLVYQKKALLSVEPSLYNIGYDCCEYGPITLEEIRLQLRDWAGANDTLDDVEFDDIEILHSMLQPIRFWNEIPPDLIRFTACNFPWHGAWLRATCANLLRIAATWYERNYMQTSAGGVTDNRRAKMNPYLVQAKTYEDQWREFVERKKIEINAADMYGYA